MCVAVAFGLPSADPRKPPAQDAGPAVVDRLTVQFGCDETFVARDPESTVVLAVQVPGILERSRGADLPYHEEIGLGEPGIVVRLEQGADLDHWCTDVMARPPRIDATWVGVSGMAKIDLVKRRTGNPSEEGRTRQVPTAAVVRLGRAILAREDRPEEKLTLPDLEIAATLGMPGGG